MILLCVFVCVVFFFQAEDGIRDRLVTGVQTCALPIYFENLKAFDARFKCPILRFIPKSLGLKYLKSSLYSAGFCINNNFCFLKDPSVSIAILIFLQYSNHHYD